MTVDGKRIRKKSTDSSKTCDTPPSTNCSENSNDYDSISSYSSLAVSASSINNSLNLTPPLSPSGDAPILNSFSDEEKIWRWYCWCKYIAYSWFIETNMEMNMSHLDMYSIAHSVSLEWLRMFGGILLLD